MPLAGVGGFFLDVLLEDGPGQVPQTQATVLGGVEIEVLRVDGLGLGDLDVYLTKVGGEAVADEYTAQVEKKPELFVCDLERDYIVFAGPQVQITGLDS